MDLTHEGASSRINKTLGMTLRRNASVNEPRNFLKFGLALPIIRQRGSSGAVSAEILPRLAPSPAS